MHTLPRQAHARRLAYDALALDPATLVAALTQCRFAVPRALLRRLGQCAAHLHAQPATSRREASLTCLRQALPRLRELADDRREAVRAFALFALVRLDPQAEWPRRWHAPVSSYERINWLLARSQAHRPDTLDGAQAALVDAHADPAVRYVAALLLTDAGVVGVVGRAGVPVELVAPILAEFLHTHKHLLRTLARRLPPWCSLDPWHRLQALGTSALTAALPQLVRLVQLSPDERTGATLARRVVALALPQPTDQTKPTEQFALSPAQRQLVAACLANGRLWVAQPTWRIPWDQFGLPTDRLELHQRLAQISSPSQAEAPAIPPTTALPPTALPPSTALPPLGIPPLELMDARCKLDWLLARHGVKNHRKMRWLDASGVADDALCACLRDAVNLQRLRLRESSVTDAGLAQLTRLSKLETLDLAGSPITDAGLVHVAALPALRVLRLGNCRISGAGLAHLAGKRSLRVLQLASPTISEADLQVLSQLPRLCLLDVSGCPMAAAAVVRLRALRPRLRIGG